MNCHHCGDKGIIRIRYQGGEPDEFALCLCSVGMDWRCDTNAGRKTYPLWFMWAARENVEHLRIRPVEDLFEDAELRAMFPFYTTDSGAPSEPIEDVLMSAGKSRRGKL